MWELAILAIEKTRIVSLGGLSFWSRLEAMDDPEGLGHATVLMWAQAFFVALFLGWLSPGVSD